MGMYGETENGLDASRDGRTKQSFRRACDINVMVAQYKKQGQFPSVARCPGCFEDVASVKSFHEAMNLVASTRELFDGLPVKIRERFRNDAGEMLAFLEDPSNREEAVKLGIIVAPSDSPGKGKDGADGASAPAGAAGTPGGVPASGKPV